MSTVQAINCGVCGEQLDRPAEYPPNIRVRSHGVDYEAHAECAVELQNERALHCKYGEHEWPAELDGDAECERGCGLKYDDWTEDEDGEEA